jgi:hypothetical protein
VTEYAAPQFDHAASAAEPTAPTAPVAVPAPAPAAAPVTGVRAMNILPGG